MVHRLTTQLLWRHVTDSAHHSSDLGLGGHGPHVRTVVRYWGRELGNSKIENFYLSVASNEQVFRLQVAMDDSLFVCRHQAISDLPPIVRAYAHGERPADEFLP